MKRFPKPILTAACLALALTILTCALLSGERKTENYNLQCAAAERMRRCMDAVKGYKAELGISISEEDKLETGLIGDYFTGITTTVGVPEAKRTAATTDMAAMTVTMLKEAGIKSGDTVGAAFSGSFPGWNLAVLSACEEMGVNLVYTASAGSSMYGANQLQLTFPDMLLRLLQDGLILTAPIAFSLGGDWDAGMEMDPDDYEVLYAKLASSGVPFLYEPDYAKNLELRLALYEEHGPISAFIGVGGNVTTIGRDEDTLPCGVIQPNEAREIKETSGLLEIYNAKGLPVLHLLNIKQLAADYGVTYDPAEQNVIGAGAVYYVTGYPWPVAAAGLCAALGLLVWGAVREKKRIKNTVEEEEKL